jgi:hypothetical protein
LTLLSRTANPWEYDLTPEDVRAARKFVTDIAAQESHHQLAAA